MGAFMQGLYRGNFATVGLAASANLYGPEGLSQAALFLAFVVPLYNILGVIALSIPIGREHNITPYNIIKEIFLNPIVIGVIIAIPFAWFDIIIPSIISNTAAYLAELTIPLALLGIGGVLTFKNRDYSLTQAVTASLIKTVIFPVIGMCVAISLQDHFSFSQQTMGILFILFACPTTSATFIMAQAMGANGRLASAIVVISTCFAGLTMGAGLYLLTSYAII
jgi:predicted permease